MRAELSFLAKLFSMLRATKTKMAKTASIKKQKLAEAEATPLYKKTVLKNGVRVVTEQHPHARGVVVGIWVMVGTRDESPALAGISHFVEHLVFKRTESRNAFEIARDMEAVGGELNAFTSREYTCFYTHSLKEHLDLSIDVLSDLVCRARFDKVDFEKEKQVVLQEIHMSEDNLEDLVFDEYFENVYGKHPLGRPILGTPESIANLKIKDVQEYYEKHYSSSQIVVSVAGAVSHDEVVKLVEQKLRPKNNKKSSKPLLLADKAQIKKNPPKTLAFRKFIQKPSEQVHILMGFPAAHFRDDLRFEAYIVNALLGGGMTSRLYQKIREDRGLVYTIYSQMNSFCDIGSIMIYSGTEPKNVNQVFKLTLKELKSIAKKGIEKKDLELFKTQVLGQILLGADDIENRMNSLGVNEMVFGRYRSVEEVLNEITQVDLKSLRKYMDKYFDLSKLSLMLMGSFEEKKAKELFSFMKAELES